MPLVNDSLKLPHGYSSPFPSGKGQVGMETAGVIRKIQAVEIGLRDTPAGNASQQRCFVRTWLR